MNGFWKPLCLLLIIFISTGAALMCYDSDLGVTVQCQNNETCITIRDWIDNITKKCGTCWPNEYEDVGCTPCSTDNCNADGNVGGPTHAAVTTNTHSTENSTSVSTTTTEKEVELTTPSGGGSDPYNGGATNRLTAVAFCLPLAIAACILMMIMLNGV